MPFFYVFRTQKQEVKKQHNKKKDKVNYSYKKQNCIVMSGRRSPFIPFHSNTFFLFGLAAWGTD